MSLNLDWLVIDWQEIHRHLSHYFYFDCNKQRFQRPVYIPVEQLPKIWDAIDIILSDIHEAKDDIANLNHLHRDSKISETLMALTKGRNLELTQINQLILLYEWTSHHYIQHFQEKTLDKTFVDNKQIKSLQREVRLLIDQKGSIDYLNHPKFRDMFTKIKHNDQFASVILKETLQLWKSQDLLQGSSYDIIDDHYVIPVKSDHYRNDLGRIMAKSQSGNTLYIEPYSVVSHSKKREELTIKLDNLKFDFCIDVTNKLLPHSDFFNEAYVTLRYYDLILGKARFAYEGDFVRPAVSHKQRSQIYGLRHPLIKKCIPNDFLFSHRALVLSGPNTGGKSVLLKSVCLAHLFFQSGLFIPASKAFIYPYEKVFYIGSDQQQLTAGLSSFGAEVEQYKKILPIMNDQSLLIIDEIFNSTSSDEASALALALIHTIIDHNKGDIILSTHHKMLKALCHRDKTIQSAHMIFDQTDLKPTYKLSLDGPGPSFALEIFARSIQHEKHNGILKKISKHARSMLNYQSIRYEQMLAELSDQSLKLQEKNKELALAITRLKQDISSKQSLQHLKIQEQYQQFQDEVLKAREKLIALKKDLPNHHFPQKSLKNQLDEISKLVTPPKTSVNQNSLDSRQPQLTIEQISVGQKYYLPKIKEIVSIVEIILRKKQVLVSAGKVKIHVSITELQSLTKDQLYACKNEVKSQELAQGQLIASNSKPTVILDCRGLRLDEFQFKVEQAITHLMGGELPFVEIIHGHGDGVLKGWLRKFLNKKKYLKWDIPENGQDGSTRIATDFK